MQMKQVKVYSSQGSADGKAQEVGVAQVPVYDSLEEMVGAMGEAVVLDLANTQNGTNIRNSIRQSAVGKPSSKALQTEAFMNLLNSGKLTALTGDMPAIQAAVDAEVNRLKAEIESKQGTETAPSA